ncbi:molybdate ABC transporter substrate-binding protein [Curtobacterium sp. MCSS17_015]|uniref:molybdate ABC transporter substrate-binding protein n=1 Tax=Curtobacterium sp. MCSS17_015 TaxID=2175666 RepID=UPI000DA7F39D|nr:molybdate ABC transporter substrate-binding protein [Curtobacterium sp. MCSS17_015]WIB25878.1 molybdate ABC transporter substrate-binding protein [Curtobacterium sp. MCSS17_015]
MSPNRSSRLRRAARPSAALAAAVLLTLVSAGCAGHPASPASTSGTGERGASGSIAVFAAASLQRTFTTLGRDFEREHPGTTVTFSFAGSSDLVSQIRNGAPADVLASADRATTEQLGADVVAGSPRDFATNTLEIAVATGNPLDVADLEDLTAPDVQLVTCAPPVPCGAATAAVERSSGVDLHPVSEEQSVTDVLGKVTSGQADAGIVYRTDVQGADGAVEGVPFAAADDAVNTYPISVLRDAADPELARAFTAYVLSTSGQRVLAAAGFGEP